MGITVEFDSRSAKKFFDDVHNAAVKKAMPSTLNRTGQKVKTMVKRELSRKTGITQKGVQDLMSIRKASASSQVFSLSIRGKTPNAIRFGARETKKHLTVRTFRKSQKIKTGFIGNKGRTAFRRQKGASRLPIRPVYGANVRRGFGASKNMKKYQKFAKVTMAVEYQARYEYFASRIKRKKR